MIHYVSYPAYIASHNSKCRLKESAIFVLRFYNPYIQLHITIVQARSYSVAKQIKPRVSFPLYTLSALSFNRISSALNSYTSYSEGLFSYGRLSTRELLSPSDYLSDGLLFS